MGLIYLPQPRRKVNNKNLFKGSCENSKLPAAASCESVVQSSKQWPENHTSVPSILGRRVLEVVLQGILLPPSTGESLVPFSANVLLIE
jgi:hypothetical protein